MIPPLLVTFFTSVTYGGVARCNHIALTTRLLRTYVQMEIKEASRHNCNMITVFESEERKQGFFDYSTAGPKYKGVEWQRDDGGVFQVEKLLSIDAVNYRRDKFESAAMIER